MLLHGRGADELDLLPLFDELDPDRRLLGVTPRGPLALPPGGAHWYALWRLGYPDPATFRSTYALGLGEGRPAPAGILALSGFIPTVEGFTMELSGRQGFPVAIGHGTFDQVIEAEWGRRARDLLTEAGADVLYREYPLPHAIDPRFLAELRPWLAESLTTA